jgi:Rrf2 family iron-sulfur cluster assembly transcriptional regulator
MRALVELGLATGRGPLSAAWIAKQEGLSVAYLEQLLHRLKIHGLVSSIRGPKGGYLLARESEQITVAEIVQILDGPSALQDGHLKDANRHTQRIAHAVFRCVHERLARSLHQVTLKDLCNEVRERAEEPLDHRYVFHI